MPSNDSRMIAPQQPTPKMTSAPPLSNISRESIIRMAAPLDRPSKSGQPVRVAKPQKLG